MDWRLRWSAFFTSLPRSPSELRRILALPYLVMYVAFTRNRIFRRYQDLGDYSYGTYIFAYPVQQSVVATMGASIGPMALCAIAAPITFILAFVSWRWVEKLQLLDYENGCFDASIRLFDQIARSSEGPKSVCDLLGPRSR